MIVKIPHSSRVTGNTEAEPSEMYHFLFAYTPETNAEKSVCRCRPAAIRQGRILVIRFFWGTYAIRRA
jgi:hypothetical protein